MASHPIVGAMRGASAGLMQMHQASEVYAETRRCAAPRPAHAGGCRDTAGLRRPSIDRSFAELCDYW